MKRFLKETIQEGEVLVIRYEGPKGGPGMREMARAMKLIYGLGLALKTALITDGRFSGTNNGCFVGHISPESRRGRTSWQLFKMENLSLLIFLPDNYTFIYLMKKSAHD